MKKIFAIIALFTTISQKSFAQEALKWGQTVSAINVSKKDTIKLKRYTLNLSYSDAAKVIEMVAPKYGKGTKRDNMDKDAFIELEAFLSEEDTTGIVEVTLRPEVAEKLIVSSNTTELESLQKEQESLNEKLTAFYAKEAIKAQIIAIEKRKSISRSNSIIK